MSQWTEEIAASLGCSDEEARSLCIETQKEFSGAVPSFKEVYLAVCALMDTGVAPARLAAHIRATEGPLGARKRGQRKGRKGAGKKSTGSMAWHKASGRHFTVDESGAIVPGGFREKPHKPSRQSLGKLAASPDKVGSFGSLKDKFAELDKDASSARAATAEKRSRRIKHQNEYWVGCPQCGDRLRLDKVGKHCKSIHMLDISASLFDDLVMSATKIDSNRKESLTPPPPPAKEPKKESFYEKSMKKHDDSKDTGDSQRKQGPHRANSAHEDHSTEAES